MSEKSPTFPVSEDAATNDQVSQEASRQHNVQRMALFIALCTGLITGVYLVIYSQGQEWQILVATALTLASAGLNLLAWNLARRGRITLATYLLFASPVLVLPSAALVFAQAATAFALVSLALIVVLSALTLPRQRIIRNTALIALSALGVLLIAEHAKPFARLDISQHPTLRAFAPSTVALALLSVAWLTLYVYRSSETIRTRLLIAFVLLVMLPAASTNIISIIVSRSSSQQQTIAQLKSVSVLKQAEINVWLDSLQQTLVATLMGQDDYQSVVNLLSASADIEPDLGAHNELLQHLNTVLEKTEHLTELFVLNLQGQVILSTSAAQRDKDFVSESFFNQGRKEPFVQPPHYDATMGYTIIIARPILDPDGARAIGVIAGRTDWEKLNEIMSQQAELSETSETYLVSQDSTLLTPTRFGDIATGSLVHKDQGVAGALREQRDVSGLFDDYRGNPVIGSYRWLPRLGVALAAKQDRGTGLGGISQTLYLNLIVTVGLIGIAMIVSLRVTRGIATPLRELAQTTAQVAAGDLQQVARIGRQDEIADLARAFNDMTTQLRGLVGELEQRVGQRTAVLERRTAYLEAAAEVSRASASILDTGRLMRQVVELIRERFGLYYVGLFRVDETGEWAVLRAGSGRAGQAMMARGHRIRVGEGMIGWSIANAESRVASRAETDTVRLTIAELPDTRSEAALPLRSRGQVLGALSVQSTQPDAFGVGLLTVLQTMADQVGVALDNARLFAESQEAVDAQRRAYGEISREAWSEMLRARPARGFYKNPQGTTPITDARQWQDADTSDVDSKSTHIIQVTRPITVRDQVIGVVNARKPPDSGQWVEEEVELLETLLNRLEEALEGARLHEQTQSRARREQMARQITEQVRAAPDIEAIAQTAAEELVRALGGKRGFVRLRTGTAGDNDQ
jgi:GAF domain-containing protein/HAMP domain-containing protein